MSLSDEELAAAFLSPSRLRTLTDEDLMQALRIGCNDALAVLFERHSPLVFRIARAILHDDGEAEETVQKVFLDIFRAVNQFNPDRGSFKTWLLQYAYHRSIDRRQHLQSNRFYSRDELDELMPAELVHRYIREGHLYSGSAAHRFLVSDATVGCRLGGAGARRRGSLPGAHWRLHLRSSHSASVRGSAPARVAAERGLISTREGTAPWGLLPQD